MADRIKVRWIHAPPIAAKMIDLQSLWDLPYEQFKRQPMSRNHMTRHVDPSVTQGVL